MRRPFRASGARSRRWTCLPWGAVAAVGLALLAMGSRAIAGAARGPVLKVAVDEAPRGWDPHRDLDPASAAHWEQIYESLVQFGPRLEVEPALSEAWDHPDARTYVFHLRRGVLFHHGREMKSGDVKFSFERARAMRLDSAEAALGGVQSVEAPDSYTVKVTLSAPDPGFLGRLAMNRGSAIVPRDVVERRGDLKAVMVGTGPFRIKKEVPDVYAELERNPRYWKAGLPRADGLVLTVVKGESARLNDLRRAAIDVGSVSGTTATTGVRDATLRVAPAAASRQLVLWLQQDRVPFGAKKVRQALSAAIDRQAIAMAWSGLGEITAALPPAALPYAIGKDAVARLPFHTRDTALSRRLLAEAAHPNGFELSIVLADSPELIATAQALRAQFREVGIKTVIQTADQARVASRLRSGDFQAVLAPMAMGAPDPDADLRPVLYGSSRDNHARYRNPEVDRLLDESRVTLAPGTRIDQWRRIQSIVAEDIPIVWLAAAPACVDLVRAHISGYAPRPDCSRVNLKYAVVSQ